MIPLLKTALKDYKDASLVVHGAKNTGKSTFIGSYSTFYLHENILTSTLGFLFEQFSKKTMWVIFLGMVSAP